MRYLLDSLQSYESGHGDALNPHRLELDKSFMGDHDALKAPTVAEFRTLSDQILTKLDKFSTQAHASRHSDTSPSRAHPPIPAMVSLSIQTVSDRTTLNLPTLAAAPTSLIPPETSSHMSREAVPTREDVPGTSIPLAGVSIPSVGKDSNSWRRAIDQWEHGDPSTGLIPLKDWPAEYYTGTM